ncbi:hypothetical protein B1O58_07745 [Listeria monocytogenes]|nr:hypothetical protein [Listeria monocytogenes]EAC3732542.1 hypothetical protein [Listeria monocytogenes]EAC5165192.1 hypothetical protein [Listeria monocytogenes]EAC7371409.1 hypothetical protein [Listeria monocytogenes]EAC9315334.1 hypothetical protein [Listeria monocytogenes]
MCYFGKENFSLFLFTRYNLEVSEKQITEESQLFYKDELDQETISNELMKVATELVLFETCVCVINEIEWMVCVASDADTSYPLFLYCLKDGVKIYEEALNDS